MQVDPPPSELYQGSAPVEPPPELLKTLLMKSFVGSSEAGFEGYMMSKIVDRKVKSKVKNLESEPVVVHFPPVTISLVKEWHQMMSIRKIRKVSMI
jgi:hypothetical protein